MSTRPRLIAKQADDPQSQLLHRIADRAATRFARTYLEGIARIRGKITENMAATAMRDPVGIQALMRLVASEPVLKQSADPTVTAIAEIIGGSMRVLMDTNLAAAGLTGADLGLTFDISNPFVASYAERHAAELVRQVTAETQRNIRAVIVDSIQNQRTPYATSKLLEQTVGLTSQQARAVLNFQGGLERLASGRMSRQALLRRWTLAPDLPKNLTPARIQALTDQYAYRQLRYRANMIARTEGIAAANAGNQATWESMIRKGYLASDARKVWVVVRDDRTCPRCLAYDGKTVGVASRFTESGTTLRFPPLHPHCRCTIQLVPRQRGVAVEPPKPKPAPREKTPKVPATFGDKIRGLRANLPAKLGRAGRANLTDDVIAQEAAIRRIGSEIQDEVARRIHVLSQTDPLTGPTAEEVRELRAKYMHLRYESMRPGIPSRELLAQRDAALKAWEDAKSAVGAADPMKRRRDVILEVLGEIRDMGGTLDLGRQRRPVLHEAARFYPKDWLDTSNANLTKLKVKASGRGFYRAADGTINIDADLGPIAGDTAGLATSTHELGHRMEHVLPEIRDLEKVFYDRRTAGEAPRRLKDITGHNYRADEMARPDGFVEAYIGKDYGAGPAAYREVVSMGMEGIFTGRFGGLLADPDMVDFILGLLATI